MADVVFILGAGCSQHAGTPVMANFLDRARDLLLMNRVDDRKNEFLNAFRVVNHLQQVHSKAQLDLQNIEGVFSAVDLARTLEKLPGFKPEEIEGALTSLIWLIVRTIEETTHIESENGLLNGTSEYRQIVQATMALKSKRGAKGPPLKSAIITFNYDVALDVALAAEKVPFDYGLTENADGSLPLLKLHGSLNWFRSKDTNDKSIRIYDVAALRQRLEVHPKENVERQTIPVSDFALKWFKNGEVEAPPFLVPPTWSKGEHYRGIGKVWARAARELGEARYIFVLGYSLPETDQFFRLLFGLGTQGEAPLTMIRLYDPNAAEVAGRFERLLGHSTKERFRHDPVKFAEGVAKVRKALGV